MFNFIKNLFKKELQREEVLLENLNKWFEEKTRPFVEDTDKNIRFKFDEFNILLNTFQKNIEDLEKSEIKEPDKIENKVKQVVLGHKENYVRRLNQFINLIKIPKEASFESAAAFCSKLDSEINEFSKDTVKTFYTVQHLFGNEVDKVAKAIKRMDDLIKDIKNITEDEKTLNIRKTREKIHNFNDTKLKKGNLVLNLNEQKSKLKKLENQKIKTINELQRLENSEEYSDYLAMNEKIKGIENDISILKDEVIQTFSPLSASLKKFERITLNDQALIEKYSEDPVNALLLDKQLKILGLLENMEKSIESGSIDIRDKKKEKVIEKIRSVHQDKLNSIVSRYISLKDNKDLLLRKIKVNSVWLKNDELKYKLDHIENSLKIYSKTSEEIDKKIDEIELDKIKQELQDNLKELTDIEISIKIA